MAIGAFVGQAWSTLLDAGGSALRNERMHAAAGTCVGARVLCAFALESGSVSEGAV